MWFLNKVYTTTITTTTPKYTFHSIPNQNLNNNYLVCAIKQIPRQPVMLFKSAFLTSLHFSTILLTYASGEANPTGFGHSVQIVKSSLFISFLLISARMQGMNDYIKAHMSLIVARQYPNHLEIRLNYPEENMQSVDLYKNLHLHYQMSGCFATGVVHALEKLSTQAKQKNAWLTSEFQFFSNLSLVFL